ncbi:uncharacterized protein LOC123553336 [Mercenaria mercenaria]|uniref:uncharacterized protein LOC123553336 n=1 Tax=Mercenaria mercenaria TaxID=6596 RepID=UPI001E1D8E10|nr:uncharacterized protein LOC123553336 [Mercenaria mercenaria]
MFNHQLYVYYTLTYLWLFTFTYRVINQPEPVRFTGLSLLKKNCLNQEEFVTTFVCQECGKTYKSRKKPSAWLYFQKEATEITDLITAAIGLSRTTFLRGRIKNYSRLAAMTDVGWKS